MTWLLWLVVALPLLVLLIGQLGGLRGRPAAELGLRDGRLAPVPEERWNAVSSQAGTRYHRIEPLALPGEPAAAFAGLADRFATLPGVRIVERTPTYLRAECATRWLGFVDDLELALDAPARVAHVRSASRLGRKDFGVNRARVESLRALIPSSPGAH